MVITLKPAHLLFYFLIAAAAISAAAFLSHNRSQDSAETFSESGAILIIDAGHGGADGGAVSLTGTYESTINLSISLKMRAIAELTATPYMMTRESEEIEYPESAGSISKKKVYDQKRRVAFIESIPGAVLISVHQNEYPTSQPRGPQAFYGRAEGSAELAKIAQQQLNAALYPENRRVAAPVASGVYLFKNAGCTALLAECGFLSNDAESRLLEEQGYQLKAALALMSAYFQYIDPTAQLS